MVPDKSKYDISQQLSLRPKHQPTLQLTRTHTYAHHMMIDGYTDLLVQVGEDLEDLAGDEAGREHDQDDRDVLLLL